MFLALELGTAQIINKSLFWDDHNITQLLYLFASQAITLFSLYHCLHCTEDLSQGMRLINSD